MTVPLPVLQRLLGHADIETTMRYVDVNEADKRDAIASVFGVAATWQLARNIRECAVEETLGLRGISALHAVSS